MYVFGIDIGGTKIEAMLVHFGKSKQVPQNFIFEYQDKEYNIQEGQVCAKKRVSTERHFGYEQIVKKIANLINDVCTESRCTLNNVKGIGLSVPGPVHPETSKITASNTMILAGHDLAADLKKELGLNIPIVMENDANCFALCEVFCGAGLEYYKQTKIPVHKQTAIGVILGSGCGGGIVAEGKLLHGSRGGCGEIGHMTLYPDGHPCYCGRRGCAEQYLSAPALEALANTRIYSQIESRPNSKKIFELYDLMDPIALAVVKEYRKSLGFFLGSLTCCLDPHYFVFGGGLSLQDTIYDNLNEEIGRNTYLPKESPQIYKHKIGDSAGAIGASLIIKQMYES